MLVLSELLRFLTTGRKKNEVGPVYKDKEARGMMGRAEDLFLRLEQGGLAYVQELIETRKSEESFLDFKRSADNGATTRLADHDRNSLAKALSGFGNSEGGVIVWGVDCSRDIEKGDVASALRPLVDPTRFVSQLDGAISGLTVPPLQGTRSIAILNSSGGGFAATYIPRSVHAPHQLVQEKRYYIRAGSSFEPVPHGVLAGLFGRGPQPVVFPNYLLNPLTINGKSVRASSKIMLVNDGSVVAEDLFVSVFATSQGGNGSILTIGQAEHRDTPFRYTGVSRYDMAAMGHREFRLPPGAFVSALSIAFEMHREPDDGLHIQIKAGCASAPPFVQDLRVDRDALAKEYAYSFERWGDESARAHVDWHAQAAKLLGQPIHWNPVGVRASMP